MWIFIFSAGKYLPCRNEYFKILYTKNFKTAKYHDYKIHLLQALVVPDFERRMLARRARGVGFESHRGTTFFSAYLQKIGFYCFANGGTWRNNYFMVRWNTLKINSQIIGSKSYKEKLNSQIYLEFLVTELPVLEDVPLVVRERMYFQQDGAPPHNARIITDYLNDTFPHRWIGKNEANRWPVRSPDLTPLDFFVGLFIS